MMAKLSSLLILLLGTFFCCQAEEALEGCFQGSAKKVTLSCQIWDANCCNSAGKDDSPFMGCVWLDTMTVTVCPNSCNGEQTCSFATTGKPLDARQSITIHRGSCNGFVACRGLGKIEDSSSVLVAEGSCLGNEACMRYRGNSIGAGSCINLERAAGGVCLEARGDIGHRSCTENKSCKRFRGGSIGDYSCRVPNACENFKGDIGHQSCNAAAQFTAVCKGEGHIGDCVESAQLAVGDDNLVVSHVKLTYDGTHCVDKKNMAAPVCTKES